MARDDVEIKVIERQTPIAAESVDYQPFGVKILKLRIQRNQDRHPDLGPIWIRPKGYVQPNADSEDPALWRVYGTAEDNPSTALRHGSGRGSGQDPDLWVAWGAGDERGFCVNTKDRFKFDKVPLPVKDDDFHYIYLHLIHRPQDPIAHTPTEKTLTVQAVGENGDTYGETTVRLTVPAAAINPLRAHWNWDLDAGASTITLKGAGDEPAQLPLYVSRWWPVRHVEYMPLDETTARFLQDLKIIYHREDNSQDRGRVDVSLGDTPLAHLTGDLALPLHDCRLCSAEVFCFVDDYHLVVRLWFYWVHLGFSPDQLMTFVPPDRRDDWRPKAEKMSSGLKKGLVPWHKREEVPDVERFDLLLDLNNLGMKYVGTDTHWQEFWARVRGSGPLEAKIALLRDTLKVAALAKHVPQKEPPVFDPLANGLCDIVNEFTGYNCPHRHKGLVLAAGDIEEGDEYETCPRCGTHFIGQDERALGIAKHAPVLGDVDVLENTVSTSVLEG
jgi:hypothetical protein